MSVRKKSKREYGRYLVFVTGLALALAGCGGDDDGGEATEATATRTQTVEQPAGGALTDLDTKPRVPDPAGSPPSRLQVDDIVKGRGAPARRGDTISGQYVGVTFSSGQEFDSSWDRGQPFSFRLGAGDVIPGWDRGLVGMRRGGRRQLTIPPDLAYGEQGSPPAIGPNETLVFVVDLVAVR